jgi:hypothetical protein
VKTSETTVFPVETKGSEELDRRAGIRQQRHRGTEKRRSKERAEGAFFLPSADLCVLSV